jgi:tRNA A37 threonylcarbamoyladenosine biosynthesis protein TsaE
MRDEPAQMPKPMEESKVSDLTKDQEAAYGMMLMMHKIFILKGYAGTGKTYLLKHFMKESGTTGRVIITAPTHKAVGIANGDSTIHSYLSLKIKTKEDKQILTQAYFMDNIVDGDILVIDEASMISRELLGYILDAQDKYNLKVIFIGDPCFKKGTKVLMYDGSIKNIENIEIGDSVMGKDSNPRIVLKKCSGISEFYKISQKCGASYNVTPNHKIAFKRRIIGKENERYKSYGDNPLIIASEAYKMSEKFHEVFGGYISGLVQFKRKDVFIDPYYLGFWLGDGDSTTTRVSTPDLEIIDFCTEYSNKLSLFCNYKWYANKNYFRISIGRSKKGGSAKNPLLEKFREYGLINNKRIPNEYLINSEHIRLNLLAGLIDSDGSYDEKGTRYSFSNKNEILFNNVKTLATQLGFRCNDRVFKNDNKTLYIYGDICRIPCKIKRKIAVRSAIKKTNTTKLSISKEGFGEYFGIEVDNDNLFLLEDCTVVSNCQIPPVGEKVSPVWELDVPNYTLTDIVRQARGSNIISLATAIREGDAYTNGVTRFVNNIDVFQGDIKMLKKFYLKCMEDDGNFPQIISYRNKIVDSSNIWARNIVKNHPLDAFLAGEEVYIRSVGEDQIHKLEDIVEIVEITKPQKYYERMVDYPFNIIKVYVASHKGEEWLSIPATEHDVRIIQQNKNAMAVRAKSKSGSWGEFWKFTYSISEIKHIYSMTCHRSQGSTFKHVAVNCNDISSKRLMYTAVTRASEKLFLFRQ